MKLPAEIENVQIVKPTEFEIFPPAGFWELEIGNDNSGDSYGLYWQLGKESQEPIVCYQSHEEFSLIPQFPNLASFLQWHAEIEGNDGPAINLSDNTFFMNLFLKGKILSKNGKAKEAIEKLEASVSLFSEYSDPWVLLAENYYKLGQKVNGDTATINSIFSNYVFGIPSKKAIDLFNAIEITDDLKQNPLIAHRTGFISGGGYAAPFSIDFGIMGSIIEDLADDGQYYQAISMNQNLGYLMHLETTTVQEKYHFDDATWKSKFLADLNLYFPERKI